MPQSVAPYRGGIALYDSKIDDLSTEGIPEAFIAAVKARDGDSRHLTIVSPLEVDKYTNFDSFVKQYKLYFLGLGKAGNSIFQIVGSPELQLARYKNSLPWYNFHVTLGFDKTDSHNVDKGPRSLINEGPRTKEYLETVYSCLEDHWNVLGKTKALQEKLIDFCLPLFTFALGKCENQQELQKKFLNLRANLFYMLRRYNECLTDVQEILAVDPVNSSALIRYADTCFKLEDFGASLIGYWKCYLIGLARGNAKIIDYCKNMLHKLWAKHIVYLEACLVGENQLITFSDDEMEKYRDLRRFVFGPTDQADQVFEESRNRLVIRCSDASVYRMRRFFSFLVPFVIAGMSTPKKEKDILALQDLGIRTIITLTEETPLNKDWFAGSKIKNHYWPVTNYYPPSIGHADQFLKEVITTFYRKEDSGATLVHCGGGKGRAGSLLACYLLRYGLTVPPKPCALCDENPALWCLDYECAYGCYPVMNASEAIQLLRSMRPGSIETDKQERFITKYVSDLYSRIGKQMRITDEINEDSNLPGQVRCEGDASVKPTFLILVGCPGSGKSWFVSKLAQNPSWVCVSQDETGSREVCESQVGVYAKTLGKPTRIILDRCNPTVADRKAWMSVAGNPTSTAIVYFNISPEICEKRAKKRFDHPTLKPHMVKTVITSFVDSLQVPSLKTDTGVKAIYQVTSFADSKALLKHFGAKIAENENFQKYPRTRHLFDLGGASRDDLVLSDKDSEAFLNVSEGHVLCIEEKIDGANLGFRLLPNGEIACANRAHDVTVASHKQFESLNAFIFRHKSSLLKVLSKNCILFGEWMVARHSILYDQLPDIFIAFDIFDLTKKKFYSRALFHKVMSSTTIATVRQVPTPEVLNRESVMKLIAQQSLFSSSATREGLVIRVDCDDHMVDKVKIVRQDFICGNEHWSKGIMEFNIVKHEDITE